MRRLASAALLASALLAPSAARADDLAPKVRYPPSTVRVPIFVAAAIVFGVGYGGVVIGATAAPEWPGSQELYIPFAGPFMSFANLRCPDADPKCDPGFLVLRGGLLGLSAIAQIGGVALAIQGFALKTEAAPAKKPQKTSAFEPTFTPFLVPTQQGVLGGVGGTF